MIKIFILILSVTSWAQAENIQKVSHRDWSVQKAGDVSLTFNAHNEKKADIKSFQDKKSGVSGSIWEFSKVKLANRQSPVLVAIFGHGVKNFSLKIIDPLLEGRKRVLFSQESEGALPTYKLMGKNRSFKNIEVVFFKNVPLEDPKMEKLYGDLPNTKAFKVRWPK